MIWTLALVGVALALAITLLLRDRKGDESRRATLIVIIVLLALVFLARSCPTSGRHPARPVPKKEKANQ